MLKGMIGKKVGMTRLFMEGGKQVSATVLEVGPCTVVQVKTDETDRYNAVQLGFGQKKAGRVTKPMAGHFAKAGAEPVRVLREFRMEDAGELAVGQSVSADIFAPGDKVNITGQSKGRGYSGVVKRHGFHGGRDTHGCTTHNRPGSIGMSADPSRVLKGKRMPGQFGNARTTVRNLKVLDVRPEQNMVVVAGAVPGANGGIVIINKA